MTAINYTTLLATLTAADTPIGLSDVENVISNFFSVDWTTWSPSYGAGGSMTFTSVTTFLAQYAITGNTLEVALVAAGTTGGSASSYITATLPVNIHEDWDASTAICGSVRTTDTTSAGGGVALVANDNNTLQVYKQAEGNWGLGSGRAFYFLGKMRVAA